MSTEAPEKITINGVDYITANSKTEGPIKIVVLDRGFVCVGYTEINGDFVEITHAKNIRQWGTTKGLGELANGPLPSTKLDQVGKVKAPVRALILLIEVDQSKWTLI